ncbi:MAG: hypothetical protein AB7K37_09270 [Cyclobacteriaceae bacterium]
MRGILLMGVVAIMVGCKSTQKVADDGPRTYVPPKEVEIIVPCSGPEYFTNSEVFRANSVGESIDLSVSKRKAMSNARSELAAAIESTVKTVTDSYVNARESNNTEDLGERFESLNRQVVSQRLTGIRKICERYYFTEEGKYKTYVAIELSAQALVEAYHQRIAKDEKLSVDVDFEKFKQTFELEMARLGGENH